MKSCVVARRAVCSIAATEASGSAHRRCFPPATAAPTPCGTVAVCALDEAWATPAISCPRSGCAPPSGRNAAAPAVRNRRHQRDHACRSRGPLPNISLPAQDGTERAHAPECFLRHLRHDRSASRMLPRKARWRIAIMATLSARIAARAASAGPLPGRHQATRVYRPADRRRPASGNRPWLYRSSRPRWRQSATAGAASDAR